MEALAKILLGCPALKLEIAGHTEAEGSTEGNLALSQARAEAVLLALQGRRVVVSGMIAKGYGEGGPVADNGDAAGREANRRIEFTLLDAPAPLTEGAAAVTAEDTSPSVAPKEITLRPKPRPERN